MADLSLKYLLYGEDKSASKAIKGVGTQATSTAGSVGSAVGRLGQMVGGEVGDMLNRVSAGFDSIGEHTKGMAPKLIAGGSAIMGLGLAMQAMASKDVESMNQLKAAVDATGKGYEGFGEDVEKLIAKQVQFGHTGDEVTTSLRVLTQAYGDPKKALGEMNLVTDLAAAKNISLADAAGLVAKAHGGAGKVFKQFGIQVGLNKDGTKDYDGALTALSGKLKGQASASMDSFGGKVKQVKTWIQDQAVALSVKYGPAVTVAGGLVTALGSVMQVMAARAAAAALAQDAAAVSTTRLSRAMSLAGSGAKMFGGPLLIAAGALLYFAKQSADSAARTDELSGTLDTQTGAITGNTRALVAKTLAESGALEAARSMGISVSDVTDAVLGNTDALARVNAGMAAYAAQGVTMGDEASANADAANKLKDAIGGTNSELTKGIANQKLQAAATKEGAGAADSAVPTVEKLAAAQKDLKDKTKTVTDAINTYNQALQDAGLAVLSTRDAQRNLIQAEVDATAAIKKNGETLSLNSPKGRENAAVLDAMAGKAIDLAKSIHTETGSEDKMRASLQSSREALVKTAEKFGMTKTQAENYADSVLKIPNKKKTDVMLAGVAKAKADAAAIKSGLDNIPKSVGVNLRYYVTTSGKAPNLGGSALGVFNVPGHAAGTSFFSGGLSWVGERGPELVSLPRGSAIHSNSDSMAMGHSKPLTGAAGSGPSRLHPADIAAIGGAVADGMKSAASSVQHVSRNRPVWG